MPAQKHGHRLLKDAMNRSLQTGYAFVLCRTIPLQKSAAKAGFSAERIVIGLLSVSVTYGLVLFVVRSVRSTKKTALNYNFRV